MSQRTERVARLIQAEIAQLIRDVKDPRVSDAGFLTVTQVRMSEDLSQARVFVSLFNGTEKQKKLLAEGLERSRGFLEREIGRRISAKKIPKLVFMVDETADRAGKVEGILAELEHERRTREPDPDDKK